MELSSRQQSSHGPVAVSSAEGSISVQNPTEDSAKCKQNVTFMYTNINSHGSFSNSKQHSASGAARCSLQITEDTIPEAAVEDDIQHCSIVTLPSVELQSVPTVCTETDSKQSTASEVVDSVSCSLNTSRKPHTNAVKLGHTWYEDVENKKDNNCISEHHCSMVCEDDLSVFFGSPVSVCTLSAKLKAIPKRKAVGKCIHDCLHSCDHACAHDEHELNSSVNCIEFPQKCVLPLHDALTADNPGVGAYVVTNEQNVIETSAVDQSSSIQQSLPFSDTSHCDLVHLLPDVSGDASVLLQSSGCLISPSSVSVLPSSSIGLVVALQDRTSSCLRSVFSEHDQPPLDVSSSVSLLDKWSSNSTSRLACKSSETQVKCCGYSEKSLQKPVKHKCANKQRFLYPSAAQVNHSLDCNVSEFSFNGEDLLFAKSSKSLLHRTPDVLQSGCIMVHSKAAEHVTKAASSGIANNESSSGVKEITVENYGANTETVLTSQLENSLQSVSNVACCGLKIIAVTSCMSTVCNIKDVNMDAAYSGSSMPDCTVIPTYCYKDQKSLSPNISTESVSASLPSLIDGICCSKLMHDFDGQTSPKTSSRMMCDVGVQASLERLASECTSNARKQPLFVNAAVQTVSVCWTRCTCNTFSQLCHGTDSLGRNELWQGHDLHDTGCITNVNDHKLPVPTVDVSNADTCESAGALGGECTDEGHYNKSLLSVEGIKTVSISNKLVTTENATCKSTTVVYGNRCTVTVSQAASPANAVVDHVLEVPQSVVSSESSVNCFSADFLSSADTGELCATECETVLADRDLDSFKTGTDNYTHVVSDVSLKSTSGFSHKSFSTGFISAGGKPLNVKFSSKLNACKLFDNLECTKGDSLKNANFSITDFPASSPYNTKEMEEHLTRMDTGQFLCTTSELLDTGNENNSDCCTSDGSVSHSSTVGNLHKNVHDHTFSLNMRNMSCEYDCELPDIFTARQQSASSSEQCFTDRVPDIMFTSAKQFTGCESTVKAHADVNNCARMLPKFHSSDVMSNGFKPFKAPRTSVQSLKHQKNNLPVNIDDEHLPDTSMAEPHGLKSADKVNNAGKTESLFDLTNTQQAEVVEASLLMLNSAELFAVPFSNDINELVAEQSVPHSSAVVNVLAPGNSGEYPSNSNISTNSNSALKYCSSVCRMPAANTEKNCENLLTGQVHHTCAEEDTETINFTINSLHSGQEDDLRDMAGCCNMPTVLMDAGFAEARPVPMDCSESCYNGKTGTDKVACCKICNDASCRCATENQKALQSFQQTIIADSIDKSETKELCDASNRHISPFVGNKCCFQNISGTEIDINNKEVKVDKDNPAHKSSPFVFFSAKGSQINVNEKTLRSIRQNQSNLFAGVNSVGSERRPVMKVADVSEQLTNVHSSQDFGLQTNTDEMHANSVTSDTFRCHVQDVAVNELTTNGNCNRNINANEADENTVQFVSAVRSHTADVQTTCVMGNEVLGLNLKSVYSVHDDADISKNCIAVSADGSYTSCVNRSAHVSYAKAAEHSLAFRATDLYSDAEVDGDKHPTEQSVLMPLCTAPESKCHLLFLLLYIGLSCFIHAFAV